MVLRIIIEYSSLRDFCLCIESILSEIITTMDERGLQMCFRFKKLLLQALCSSSFMYCFAGTKTSKQTRVRHGIVNWVPHSIVHKLRHFLSSLNLLVCQTEPPPPPGIIIH
jgi:hypothetical protein